MTLKEASIEQLKASAYDILAQQQALSNELNIINGEIAERNKKMPEVTTEEIETTPVTEPTETPVEATPEAEQAE